MPRDASAPARVVHLGLGAFHRAHQAWYTQAAIDDGHPASITAFTGRSPVAAERLAAQDHRYTLIERADDGDTGRVIRSIDAASDGADRALWLRSVGDPEVGVVTVTVTEAGYHAVAGPHLDREHPEVAADIAALRGDGAARTAPGRLVDGLRSRRDLLGDAIAIVSCDNLAANGAVARAVVTELAREVEPALADWIDRTVTFPSTMVDRITPATTDADRGIASELSGFDDADPVVTEPFTEWILAGEFPAGRPHWESGGARFVGDDPADVEPFERRKLWLLNGAHSLLAYRGLEDGFSTIAEAFADPTLRASVEDLWAEARPVLPFDDAELDAATAALRSRFANARIEHRLEQIAADGSKKLSQRILAPLSARLDAGRDVGGAEVSVLAAWARHLDDPRRHDPASDALADRVRGADGAGRAHLVADFLGAPAPVEPALAEALEARPPRG